MFGGHDGEPPTSSDAQTLVRAALGGPEGPNLPMLLECIARLTDAHGCVLWEVAPGSDLDAERPDGRLYALASHFPAEARCATHDLPLAQSTTGQVVLEQAPRLLDPEAEVWTDEARIDPFLARSLSMLAVPVIFRDGSRGALNVYRKHARPFDEADLRRLSNAADLLPPIYQAIRDNVGARLIGEINAILHGAETRSAGKLLPKSEKKAVLRSICDRIAQAFRCREVSVFLFDCREISLFLANQSEEPVRYELMASTVIEPLKKSHYSADEADGLSGWVLKRGEPVWIFDLEYYQRDRAWIEKRYPGLDWKDHMKIREVTRKLLSLGLDDALPPLCVLAMPVLIGEKVVGLIRCSIAEGPYYFSIRDSALLHLIAAQIAQGWSTWLSLREKAAANESWEELAHTLVSLNELVQKQALREEPSEIPIYNEAASRAIHIIRGAELNSVRLVDLKTRELYFAAIAGPRWQARLWPKLSTIRVPIDPDPSGSPPRTVAFHAIQTRQTQLIRDVSRDPIYKELFPGVRRMILAPIVGETQDFGVLSIRGFDEYPFPKNAPALADLLARQVGLYRRLLDTIRRLRNEQKQQIQTWSDISHQLKGPVSQAKSRADIAVEKSGGIKSPFLAVRGLCRKAQHVVASLRLLADLASNRSPEPARATLGPDQLVTMLIEASQDTESMIHPRRNIRFHVERDTFTPPPAGRRLEVDHALLEQAIDALFDNAAKYSYNNTTVRIFGGYAAGFFALGVENIGLPISSDEVKSCLLREWRGFRARKATQEGSGIGLWIVDHIMKAHGGQIVLIPTAADSSTIVRLEFPMT
jgi:signal transduction histidine kinase